MNKNWNIQLKNLTIGYGKNIILEKIDGSLPAGKISVILGASGCGKSTLLRNIIGLSQPFSGEIYIGDKNFFALPAKGFRDIRRRMGVLFQDGALLGSLSVIDNVALPLYEHTSLPRETIRKAALFRLALVGLEKFADYYPTELSGGMRKRAGLARALIGDPKLLLCDEPTSGLDPINAAQMDVLLLAMKGRFPDMAIVVVSHDLASVKNIADHILVLHEKKLLFTGSKDELYASELPYLQQFLQRKAPLQDTERAHIATPDKAVDEAVRKALNL